MRVGLLCRVMLCILCMLWIVGCGQLPLPNEPSESTQKEQTTSIESADAEQERVPDFEKKRQPKEHTITSDDAGESASPDNRHSETLAEPVTEEPSTDEGLTQEENPSEQQQPDSIPTDPCKTSPLKQLYGKDVVTVSCHSEQGGYRTYTLSTTHPLRDNKPASKKIQFSERKGSGELFLRSGNILFDALFAMAVDETWQNSVKQVKDGSFRKGQPVPCTCYQTGASWTWAWTRDTAYAVDLALASYAPQRSKNTLLFKISDRKAKTGGKGPQIIQDTGTGGSWPVSSDRVVWALSAWRLALVLPPTERKRFLLKAYPALSTTLQLDRKVLFDTKDGLYRGEQSFLDWREQTYPSWTKKRLWHIAMSKALSTNMTHLIAFEAAAKMAKALGKSTEEKLYLTWSQDLRKSIQQKFYIASVGLYSSMLTTTLDPSAVYKYDLLGNALAILWGIADRQTAKKVVSSYPHSDKGPPVVWPQQPFTPIYHNRAIWPFVTAYWIRAAKHAKHAKAVSHNMRSMVRGAALNLSNMENFEFLSGTNYVRDGKYSGPIVNSRRQLWSVAGYLSMVQDILFGLELHEQGIRFLPFFPRELRQAWFPANTMSLHGFMYQGKRLDITLHLPPKSSDSSGIFQIQTITLNGVHVGKMWLKASQLKPSNALVITLSQPTQSTKEAIKVVKDNKDFRLFWSPREPSITRLIQVGNTLQLTLSSNGEQGVTHNVYRDGVLVGKDVPSGTWTDITATKYPTHSYCYAVDSGFTSSKNRSHHSLPKCWLGKKREREQNLDVYRFASVGGSWGNSGSVKAYLKWGQGKDSLEIAALRPTWTGEHLLQLVYRNPHGGFTSGIVCATKRVRLFDNTSGQLLKEAILVMPTSENLPQAFSSEMRVVLNANNTYRLRIDNADIVHNMSYLQHFSLYTAGPGGGSQPFNQVEIQGLRLFPISGKKSKITTGSVIAFDGKDDIKKYKPTQVVTPGIQLKTWERFALTWDRDWLYITIVSQGFENGVKAFNLYLETAGATWPTVKQGSGIRYLNQVPMLPFTPTYMLGVRRQSNNNDGFGPWNGIWRKTTKGWILQTRFKTKSDYVVASDKHTISYRVHRAELGWPQKLRWAGHLVNHVAGNEWKLTLPKSHTPWVHSNKGYYEIELANPPNSSKWVVK